MESIHKLIEWISSFFILWLLLACIFFYYAFVFEVPKKLPFPFTEKEKKRLLQWKVMLFSFQEGRGQMVTAFALAILFTIFFLISFSQFF